MIRRYLFWGRPLHVVRRTEWISAIVEQRVGLTENIILRMTDLVTARTCAVRIDASDSDLTLERLLDKYLKNPRTSALLDDRRITDSSAETLAAIQDLVYVSSNSGQLGAMFSGVEFQQGGRGLPMDCVPIAEPVEIREREAQVIDLQIDRAGVGYDRNWVGFHRRRWARRSAAFTDFVDDSIQAYFGRERAKRIRELESTDDKTNFVWALARRIWDSDFENYSRFTGRKLVYKSGDETAIGVMEGCGGICSEKVQALKFLTDQYGIDSEYVLSGPNTPDPAPETRLRQMLDTLDFRFSKRFMRYWQHTALLYTFDRQNLLVDATNGNIPFIFASGAEADELLRPVSKRPVRVRMAVRDEDFYYHRVSQDIVEDMIFAMEGWIPYVDLVQVFDNELGLCITKEYMAAPIVFRTERTFDTLRGQYLRACAEAGVQCEVSDTWGLDGPIAESFAKDEPRKAERIFDSYDHLLDRYDDAHGTGHEAGLAVIRLAAEKVTPER